MAAVVIAMKVREQTEREYAADTRGPGQPAQSLPDVPELSERLGKPDPVFAAWRGRQNKKSWVHLDLSALRIGYELGLRAVNAECLELRKHNAALAACWSKAVDRAEAVEAKVATLTQQPAEAQPAWRDIATAPKDGTVIWAFNGEQGRMRWIEGAEYALWIYDDELLSDACPEPDQPTHWMPLPVEPAPPGNSDER
ncbi:MAG TPA: hypothetical protein VF292_02890 [Rhodanobacteraceae bacterium]